MTKLYYFQGVWSPTHLNSTSKRFLKINENYKKLRAHVCVHILVMDRPQPLLRTALQFRKFSPASHLDFFSFIFFSKAHCLRCRVQMKETPLQPLYLFLCAAFLFPSTAGHIEVGLQQRGTGMSRHISPSPSGSEPVMRGESSWSSRAGKPGGPSPQSPLNEEPDGGRGNS